MAEQTSSRRIKKLKKNGNPRKEQVYFKNAVKKDFSKIKNANKQKNWQNKCLKATTFKERSQRET